MIKKIFLFIMTLILLIIACSCKDNTSSDSESENLYFVEDNQENYIIFKFPFRDEFNDTTNKFIEDYIITKIYELSGEKFNLIGDSILTERENPQNVEYYINIDSNVAYTSRDTVSIVFNGIFNKKSAAHPINLFFTLNFDPNTMEKIDLTKRYIVDSTLYNNFAKLAEKQLAQELGGAWPNAWESFSKQFCSEKEFLEGISLKPEGESIYWHYTKTGIVFSYLVPYALGDHKEVELNYDMLTIR